MATVNCCLITPNGLVFLDIPWEQLEAARNAYSKVPKGSQVIWEIIGSDGTVYQALFILAKYYVNPKAGDGDES